MNYKKLNYFKMQPVPDALMHIWSVKTLQISPSKLNYVAIIPILKTK